MITSKELHERYFFEMENSKDELYFSGKYGVLLYRNGDGFIPYYWKDGEFVPGKMFTELFELDDIISNYS